MARFDSRRTNALVLFLLAALVLAIPTYRAVLEQSLWLDEISTLMMVNHTVPEIIELRRADRNPPGYFIALKIWIRIGKEIGAAPSVWWARMLNVVFLAALVCACLRLGKALLDRTGAVLLTIAVAACGHAAYGARELRPYGPAFCAITTCFLFLPVLSFSAVQPGTSKRSLLWLIYAILLSVALWSHYLAFPAGVLLAAGWLLFGLIHNCSRDYFVAGATAHLLAFASFAPWLLLIRDDFGEMALDAANWRTPPTVMNWWRVFTFWYPFGAMTPPGSAWMKSLFKILGVLTLLIPAAGTALFLRRNPDTRMRNAFKSAWMIGGIIAVVNVSILWILDRYRIATTFHGPRYPIFTAGIWAASLLFLCWSARDRTARARLIPFLMLPWIATSYIGQIRLALAERNAGFDNLRSFAPDLFPRAGETLYVFPIDLIPYRARVLESYNVKPIHELAEVPQETTAAVVLCLNPWVAQDRLDESHWRTRLEQNLLAEQTDSASLPPATTEYRVHRLRNLNHQALKPLQGR